MTTSTRDKRINFQNSAALSYISISQADKSTIQMCCHKGHVVIGLQSHPNVTLYDGTTRRLDYSDLASTLGAINGVDVVTGTLQQGFIMLSIKDDFDAYILIPQVLEILDQKGCLSSRDMVEASTAFACPEQICHQATVRGPIIQDHQSTQL